MFHDMDFHEQVDEGDDVKDQEHEMTEEKEDRELVFVTEGLKADYSRSEITECHEIAHKPDKGCQPEDQCQYGGGQVWGMGRILWSVVTE